MSFCFLHFIFRLLFDGLSKHSTLGSFPFPCLHLSLSLSNATLRNEYDERDEKDDATYPSWNIETTITTAQAFAFGQVKRAITDHSIRYIDKYLSITPCTCTYLPSIQPKLSHDSSSRSLTLSAHVHIHMLHAPTRLNVVR
jgi:hypothetical protein